VTTGPQSEEKGSSVSREFEETAVRNYVDSVKFRFQFENSTSDAALGDNQERLVRGLVEPRKIRVHFVGYLAGDCGEAAAVTCKQ
jgi:hypothetical protein